MRMSLAQRVLMTWLFTLLFLIVLVLKLDDKAHWNWFLIFIPLWIFDAILLFMLIVKIARKCKSAYDRSGGKLKRKVWYLCAMLLKLGFLVALCARLEHITDTKLTFVFIPLWMLLIGAMVDIGCNTFPRDQTD
ncbi:transmembrane protein 60 [Callorhinchus milii]|uniref:Transmembrane protein 60 n=1 Tax=Callorhinchus milii TaxID=7868 RepID=V9L8K4_CALMI|nr:transmembrane protein 60 [Callorhinchus milii]|eukprot:gi/632947540/ref/XP_007889097.1/ PREDICTED: transmembrane protein 60 [Callorhinchus milii]